MIQELKKMMMKAKLEKNLLKSNLLSTLVAEAVMVGKNEGNRETTEAETLNIIKKFLKNVNENIKMLDELGKDKNDALKEKEILESLLPKQLSSEDLEKVVMEIVAKLPEKSPKMMGAVMAELKKNHDGQFDGKMASEAVKKCLSN
ncbi:MAG TPA: GatB/YqeY domain-containing protein [bacterium]|nr:GatB/YqeY domain-containing protein [bacterium]HPS30272.1 GatB/YqeY domain-containing protein [bacterium]